MSPQLTGQGAAKPVIGKSGRPIWFIEWESESGDGPASWFVEATDEQADLIRAWLNRYMADYRPFITQVYDEADPFEYFQQEIMGGYEEDTDANG